jgi:hypothetical protein
LQITDGDRNNWSKEEKIAYLEAFRSSALEEDSGVDVETLRYVTGEDGNSLGLSLGTNFRELSDEALNAAINGLGKLADSASELSEDLDKVSKDSRIASLTLALFFFTTNVLFFCLSWNNKSQSLALLSGSSPLTCVIYSLLKEPSVICFDRKAAAFCVLA